MNLLTQKIQPGTELQADDVRLAAKALTDPDVSAESKADFLRALAKRGETPSEIAGFVEVFLTLAIQPEIDRTRLRGPMLDVVGTGGDHLNLFNVSTTAMFILAGAGVCVTKHGNRGVTSKSGGADVLEALGVRIDLPPDRVARSIETIGLGFLFAPIYHPAFKAVAPARQLLASQGQRSMFNLLGPLLNPARPDHQLIGVFDETWAAPFAEILRRLGRTSAWIVHGTAGRKQGMDELSTLGPNTVCQLSHQLISETTIRPSDLGISKPKLSDLAGGDAVTNADILEGILNGSVQGPKRDLACLNAAAGLVVTGLAPDLMAGLALANQSIDRGAAHASLRAMQDWC